MFRLWPLFFVLLPQLAFGQITFINGSHADGSVTSLTPAEPTNCAEDDLITAHAMWDDNPAHSNTIVDPPDFNQTDQFLETVGSDSQVYFGWKIRGATAGDALDFTVGTADDGQVTLLCWRGIDTGTPFDVTWVKATHYIAYSNNVNAAAKAITTVTDNSMVVLVYMLSGKLSNAAAGPPATFTTALTDSLTSSHDGHDSAYLINASASLITPGVWTHVDTLGIGDPRNFTFALRPSSVSIVPIIVTLNRRHRL